jgi:hypothetical protein
MASLSDIFYISELLQAPQNIKAADEEKIAAIRQAYPYFAPAYYLDAVLKSKQQSAHDAVLTQLYAGNRVLYHEFMETAQNSGGKEKESAQESDKQKESGMNVQDKMEEARDEELLIQPVYTDDYFRQQGMQVSDELPSDMDELKQKPKEETKNEGPQSLMVVMSFSEWLAHFKTKEQENREENESKKALKTMWQKEKLAAAMEEEDEEIPEQVFEMAVNSITREEDLASESLAEVFVKQRKYDKAIDMYRKLSLREPQKKAYFARKIENILKEKQ